MTCFPIWLVKEGFTFALKKKNASDLLDSETSFYSDYKKLVGLYRKRKKNALPAAENLVKLWEEETNNPSGDEQAVVNTICRHLNDRMPQISPIKHENSDFGR